MLRALAAVAFAIVIVRAAAASITIDEASSFLNFVWRYQPVYWQPSPANHVLNSLLQSVFIRVFPPSAFVVRLPALLGAILYISTALRFCERFVRDSLLAPVSLACLIFNPFVLDYLIVARGYSLALGFFMLTIYLLSEARRGPRNQGLLVVASSAGGFCVTANFSFGIAILVTIVAFGAVIWIEDRKQSIVELGLSLLLPAPTVALFLCGPAITNLRAGDLYYGTKSVGDMLGSALRLSIERPSDYIVNPSIYGLFRGIEFLVPFLLAALLLWGLVLTVRSRMVAQNPAALLLAILVISIAMQITFAGITHTPLPVNRTILYVAPLATLVIVMLLASARDRAYTVAGTIVLLAVAALFVACTRMNFEEWNFDANSAQIYTALRAIEARSPGSPIGTNSTYVWELNFYQAVDPSPTFPTIDDTVKSPELIPRDRSVYVLTAGDDDAFAARERLTVVYSLATPNFHNTEIAVRAGLAVPTLRNSPSL